MHVRTMRRGDVEAVAALSAQLGYAASSADLAPRIEAILARPDHLAAVAEDGAAIAGWIHAQASPLLTAASIAEVRALVVDESRRGQGVGTALLRAAEAWAGRQGFPEVRVRTNVAREAAPRFYERMGYVQAKTQRVFTKRLR